MAKTIKILNEDRINKINKCIYEIRKGFPNLHKDPFRNSSQYLYHYTSFEKLFNILDGDAFWASRSRFSNDSTEDRVLGSEWAKKEQYYGDNYILCFCEKDDILSQWRGYCPHGGASIGFNFPMGYSNFSLLHANYDETVISSSNSFETYKNKPLPVVYCKESGTFIPGVDTNDLMKIFESPEIKEIGINIVDIVPYLKSGYFYDELEFRLVFDNSNGDLEKCIRFRKVNDGTRVPYMVVKSGDLTEKGRLLSPTYDEKEIQKLFELNTDRSSQMPIVIPYGRDQSKVCTTLSNKIKEHKRNIFMDGAKIIEQRLWEKNPLHVICEGHLPIVSITVSPSPQQEYMKEAIERFCKSKYWLQNVEVKCSKIPYIAPKL